MPFTVGFDIYLKWKLDYSIFVLHIQFFPVEFQVNQQNIHPTLTILKFVLALHIHCSHELRDKLKQVIKP